MLMRCPAMPFFVHLQIRTKDDTLRCINMELKVRFYATAAGNERVREWLKALGAAERKLIGTDVKVVRKNGRWGCRWSASWSRDSGSFGRNFPWAPPRSIHGRGGYAGSVARLHEEDVEDAPSGTRAGTTQTAYVEGERTVNEKHLGSDFDDFLREEGLLEEVEGLAAKKVLALQIARLMEEQQVSKAEMARRMQTSRAAVDRLLKMDSESATLATLEKAAAALGRRLQISFV